MTSPVAFVPDLARLERDVRRLAVPRHPLNSMDALRQAEDVVALELGAAGLRVERQVFSWDRREFHNVIATRDGDDPARPWVIVGAHFDSTPSTPGADDNASAVAAMFEVARLLRAWQPAATIQYVGFNLEEVYHLWPPVYRIGSRAYVEWLRSRQTRVAGAFVLEMVGYTSPTQSAPAAVQLVRRIPKVGNFLAAVGDWNSRALIDVFERAVGDTLPLETLAVPMKGWLVPDVRRSDNARFWDAGYPALMVTDTADLRNPNYHRASDTPGTLDYGFMGKVVEVVTRAVLELAG